MNSNEIEEIASRIVNLSIAAKNEHLDEKEDALLHIAANLELLSPELQNCWGGPLNGQQGRRAIFQELIQSIKFDAIFETGTYRGLTTAWFADHFSGTIYSCEIDRRYHYQAQKNLQTHNNIKLSLEDSRSFLHRHLAAAPEEDRYFIYLDAHWHDDLPLIEEIRIILNSPCTYVIAIDDFKVPADDYQYDNYGPGKILSIELLEEFKDESIQFFFPKLPASLETGAARGVCIIAKELAVDVGKCDLLQGKSWTEWRATEADHDTLKANRVMTQDLSKLSDIIFQNQKTEIELSNTMSSVKSGILNLLESQSSLEKTVKDFFHSLDDHLETIDDRREIGRALVEERAKNLDLERQNQRLRENLEFQNQTLKEHIERQNGIPRNQSSIEPIPIFNELTRANDLAKNLAKSRTLNAISFITPRIKRRVLELSKKLEELTQKLS
jgi:predicted O-methyltransferase YrrM